MSIGMKDAIQFLLKGGSFGIIGLKDFQILVPQIRRLKVNGIQVAYRFDEFNSRTIILTIPNADKILDTLLIKLNILLRKSRC
jgi:hypothetical protein